MQNYKAKLHCVFKLELLIVRKKGYFLNILPGQALGNTFILNFDIYWNETQRTLTCSKSTVETLEKGVKYVQS